MVDLTERLWEAPPYRPALARATAALAPWLPRALALAWLATMVVLLGFEPTPSEVTPPLWADLVVTVFFLALATSAFAALTRHGRVALWASLGAASVGLLLGWACRATAHHIGSWWLVEVGIFAGLLALTAASLAARRR